MILSDIKTRDGGERFIFDKAGIAGILNSFKNDPFWHPPCEFIYKDIFNINDVEGKQQYSFLFDKNI